MAFSTYNKLLRLLRTGHFTPLAALFHIDLHDIRGLNFNSGPHGADRVIARVEKVVAAWAGAEGVSGRLWSNEFIVAKSVDHPQSVIEEALQLRALLLSQGLTESLGGWNLAVSIGVSCASANRDRATLMRQAAVACEYAKRRGRNQIVPYSAIASETGQHAIDIDHVDNFQALKRNGLLTLHAQPIIDIRDGKSKLVKAEFLLRIKQGDSYGPPPPHMIAALENCGKVNELDRFAADHILAWLDDHGSAMTKLSSVSINLSARSVADGSFMHKLFSDVRSARLPPGQLGFEITETAAIKHLQIASEAIAEFRSIGCPFSLDDFGSGLCSFAYLNSLPVDEVKLDGCFIRNIATEPLSRQIVSAIHQIAHTAGKKTIAEFVDSAAALGVLREIGVDYAQGWQFYPAMPPERLIELLQRPVH